MTDTTNLTTIGRAETIYLPDLLGKTPVPAKIDTGADTSSLWATDVRETDAGLHFIVFGPSYQHYTGQAVIVPKGGYRLTRVANSFGHREERYAVKTPIRLGGRRVLATFTLADRSNKTYPMLLGRRLLKGKFIVNVAAGDPLLAVEKAKRLLLRRELRKRK